VIDKAKSYLVVLTELGLVLVGVGIVLQVLFGETVPFVGGDTVGNLIGFIGDIGSGGYIGLIALGALFWLFGRRAL
tara:strand:- start:624 stop:851 length:228 start_codon:yes stop_codon:yes gene_type:complete